MLRLLLNFFFPSRFIFPDGSRVDYFIRDDSLQYSATTPRKDVVVIPLLYNSETDKSWIDPAFTWKWQSNGTPLIAEEKNELIKKINLFMKRRPREFESL